jgi:hypothetical protein
MRLDHQKCLRASKAPFPNRFQLIRQLVDQILIRYLLGQVRLDDASSAGGADWGRRTVLALARPSVSSGFE